MESSSPAFSVLHMANWGGIHWLVEEEGLQRAAAREGAVAWEVEVEVEVILWLQRLNLAGAGLVVLEEMFAAMVTEVTVEETERAGVVVLEEMFAAMVTEVTVEETERAGVVVLEEMFAAMVTEVTVEETERVGVVMQETEDAVAELEAVSEDVEVLAVVPVTEVVVAVAVAED
ncbi:hypothetical protein VOLCADRAFT_87126 [Volvox carteri f. nagariensis]|uniref:Uncharacterized protein n=1 Tax=Volvox carteri f. nagariensis TaxID=3068 RepID=D8TK86_VOLCA|nr:uncharacterized protein VOLCADRAFT_87126 [Volvox carteri f. nagariensis]EFJ52019.1 hypothetical protein VOLCADRAFT_87126 [Volvox carteri f. nagariensis]|eukprot:XP_002946793.1 hypothetical protein VOLCADRAFT_87126 [Volvox carteri f. nagariensis]